MSYTKDGSVSNGLIFYKKTVSSTAIYFGVTYHEPKCFLLNFLATFLQTIFVEEVSFYKVIPAQRT